MDRHETIVTGRCETFRYCHIGGIGMTSAELKHRVKLQEWAARIQDCRSSGLSVRAWCRQEEINAATYYRWERELLALAETEPCSSVSAVRFAELPAPKRVSRNVAERSATLHIGNASLDIYPGCDTEQLTLQNEWLLEQLKLSKKKLFGRSSEQAEQMVMEQLSFTYVPAGTGIQSSGLETVPADHGQLAVEGLREVAAVGL